MTSQPSNPQPNGSAAPDPEPGHVSSGDGGKTQYVSPQRNHWRANISLARVSSVPIACAFASGIVDSTMFNAFQTFVSMQTGNTIFLALGASQQNTTAFAWAKSLLAVACFSLGSFFFSRLSRRLSPQTRISLLSSFTIQALLCLISAALAQSGAIPAPVPAPPLPASAPASDVAWSTLAPIALLAFQSAGQIVAARALGVAEVPTVVVTSLLCDLWADPQLFAAFAQNKKRNHRVAAFVLTLVGAIVGGWTSKRTEGIAASLWVVGGIKAVIAVGWAVWPIRKEGEAKENA